MGIRMSNVKSNIIIDKLIESFGLFLSVYIHSCFRPKANGHFFDDLPLAFSLQPSAFGLI